MKSISPITPGHLLERLLKIGFFQKSQSSLSGHQNPLTPQRVGICVSGGPDSMALAYLIQNMPHPQVDGLKAFSPHAFVIDHGVRDGSYEEAVWVQNQLEKLDIETEIGRVMWSRSVDPKSIQGFELAAREKRYRMLAHLAAKHRLLDLFTGHHEDDQVETIIARLIRDRTVNPLSFQAMETTTNLPCTEDYLSATSHSSPIRSPFTAVPESRTSTEVTGQQQREAYRPGVQLHRPLLYHQKSDLVATCDHFKIPYVHDKTNFDPQLTLRNTIRHLRTNYSLPRALQSTSLLNSHVGVNTIMAAIKEQAHEFRKNILGFQMHSESGLVFLRLRPLPPSVDERQLRGFAYFVQTIINLVSPLKRIHRHTMTDRQRTELLYELVSKRAGPRISSLDSVTCLRPHNSSHNEPVLSFSRQPFSQAEKNTLNMRFSDHNPSLFAKSLNGNRYRTNPLLWDQRFWIRIVGDEDAVRNTIIRPYCADDVHRVISRLKEHKMDEKFKMLLSTVAPGHVRFTLPVLVLSGEVVAFPTLDFKVVPSLPLDWSVRYHRDSRAVDFFFPDTKHKPEISWNFGNTEDLLSAEDYFSFVEINPPKIKNA